MNLRNWFDKTFANRPSETALEWDGSVYTFGEIDARSNRMARALSARGLAQGDRLCVYLANSIEMIDLYLACIKLGVIFVPINILYRDREMSHILSDAEPRALIAVDAKNDATVTTEVPIWTPADLCREAAGM